jgi:hypothetical protein
MRETNGQLGSIEDLNVFNVASWIYPFDLDRMLLCLLSLVSSLDCHDEGDGVQSQEEYGPASVCALKHAGLNKEVSAERGLQFWNKVNPAGMKFIKLSYCSFFVIEGSR